MSDDDGGWSADSADEAEAAAEQRDAARDKRAQQMRKRARVAAAASASASSSAAPPPPPPPATAAARRTAEQLLLRALEENNPDLAEYPRAHMARLAAALAAALSSVAGPRAYASRVRSVAYNLRSHNHELRRRVCAELVAPAEVAAMPAASLATDALRQEREETAVRKRKGVTQRPDEGGTRAAATCPSCGGRDQVRALPASGQRDIRKAEVWGGPADEAPTLLRCSGCGESWHVEDVELIADDDLKVAPPPKRSCVLSWKGSMAGAAE